LEPGDKAVLKTKDPFKRGQHVGQQYILLALFDITIHMLSKILANVGLNLSRAELNLHPSVESLYRAADISGVQFNLMLSIYLLLNFRNLWRAISKLSSLAYT
jgi:hypothetical protein